MTVKVKNHSNNPLPAYQTTGSAGMDICANIDWLLHPGQWSAIPTGIFLEIPEGYECQVRPRSGLAFKNGVTVLNSPGTIDSDFRGEVKVILINHSNTPFVIQQGDRIAQLVFNKVETAVFELSDELSSSERGAGGFGSTGK